MQRLSHKISQVTCGKTNKERSSQVQKDYLIKIHQVTCGKTNKERSSRVQEANKEA